MQEIEGADASLETEVEAEAEVQELESEAESPPAEESDTKPDPFQERIDRLTERFRDTERDLGSVAKERDELRKKLDALDKPAEEKPKTLSDFDYDESQYQRYVWDEADKRAEVAAEKAAKRVADEYTERQRTGESQKQFETKEKELAKEVKDYFDVVESRWACSLDMAEEIRGSDIGPEMAYYLAKNPDEAMDIARAPQHSAIRRMVALEGRLLSEKSASGKKVSDAPPPPSKTVKGAEPGARVATTDPKSDKMSDAEWFKQENARQVKLRGK